MGQVFYLPQTQKETDQKGIKQMMTCYCHKSHQQNQRPGNYQYTGGCGQGYNRQGCGQGGWVSENQYCGCEWRFCNCPRQNSWGYGGEYEDNNFYY